MLTELLEQVNLTESNKVKLCNTIVDKDFALCLLKSAIHSGYRNINQITMAFYLDVLNEENYAR